ncbi:MAG: hypothetical protein ACTSP9_14660 [Promethearchaeota archaeon]|uniref:Uncharacterized protein n=1 Tax=marine sediment metagenome TaxID=412755 RepID=X0ZJ13_9ZZZZ
MKKNEIRKRLNGMKTAEWNERNTLLEEEKMKGEDNDWNEKNDEDEEIGENKNDFHEELYDK